VFIFENEKRSFDVQIIKIQEQQKRLKERERKLKSQQAQKERKERTKRLIEIGATVEGVLGKPIPKEDLIKLKKYLEQQEQRGKFFSKAMSIPIEIKVENNLPKKTSENGLPLKQSADSFSLDTDTK
jgi:hypothetical protein